jgi:BirA family biotin operon repressor/biotin-[acetyl-CoA-carboxylase] ligase
MKEQREWLDAKKITAEIAPQNRAFLSRLEIFDSINSTNTYLLSEAKKFLNKRETGWVCFAEQQTQGRGRQNKEWFSPYATNLYCSLSWSFSASFESLSSLSLVCGILVIQTLKKWGLTEGLGLKWPNDVLFSGRKLAGILLENLVSPQQNWVVIGIGLNLFLPEDKNPAWIGVEEASEKAVSRNELAGLLLNEFLAGLALFEKEGLKPFLAAIREYDLLLQKEVLVQTATGLTKGLARGLNEQGELLLRDEAGTEHQFAYGEVSVRLK